MKEETKRVKVEQSESVDLSIAQFKTLTKRRKTTNPDGSSVEEELIITEGKDFVAGKKTTSTFLIEHLQTADFDYTMDSDTEEPTTSQDVTPDLGPYVDRLYELSDMDPRLKKTIGLPFRRFPRTTLPSSLRLLLRELDLLEVLVAAEPDTPLPEDSDSEKPVWLPPLLAIKACRAVVDEWLGELTRVEEVNKNIKAAALADQAKRSELRRLGKLSTKTETTRPSNRLINWKAEGRPHLVTIVSERIFSTVPEELRVNMTQHDFETEHVAYLHYVRHVTNVMQELPRRTLQAWLNGSSSMTFPPDIDLTPRPSHALALFSWSLGGRGNPPPRQIYSSWEWYANSAPDDLRRLTLLEV